MKNASEEVLSKNPKKYGKFNFDQLLKFPAFEQKVGENSPEQKSDLLTNISSQHLGPIKIKEFNPDGEFFDKRFGNSMNTTGMKNTKH